MAWKEKKANVWAEVLNQRRSSVQLRYAWFSDEAIGKKKKKVWLQMATRESAEVEEGGGDESGSTLRQQFIQILNLR